ncbi:peroxide stress protein YaaA [Pelagovum pacificum]|uniref:UPF0246 protein FHY64_11850 n=1 Tax=Pelagovum pacificum TaxID=2588711 RepID=A0A5C5GHZ2_9RHOB|nr:peroxide stress protein YaaA [Pelagovum pacificum]QQA42935.1 peroxide stress protein YaaA [Pelagovum pacificum]TNY34392.1 peroxide stress protein YaaA [Pelagovum pacificum]
MLVTISPAKSLAEGPFPGEITRPVFEDEALRLAKTARNMPLRDLKALMDLSDDLARLNRDRFRDYRDDPADEDLAPAAFLFDGDTYRGLEAKTLEPDALSYAQDHLRILSGLYGVLRPLDGIQPYRLEMGVKLKTRRGTSLYQFWRDEVAKALNAQAEEVGTEVLLNCASKEYFTAADRPALKLKVITPSFLEERNGKRTMVSFFAKQARGALARFVMENRVTDPADLSGFETGGYQFDPEASTDDAPVFSRPYPDA